MEEGVFRTFVHDHAFLEAPGGTLMRDTLRFSAPLGLLGRWVEVLVLRRHMIAFLSERNRVIKATAESPEGLWKAYLGAAE
jgi:ligand-binding SRPBCC domain-containing protein